MPMPLQHLTQQETKVLRSLLLLHHKEYKMINRFLKFKTLFWSLIVISSTIQTAQGYSCELTQEPLSCCISQPFFEVKTGYVFFTDSKLRKVYDRGGVDVQLCASYPLLNLTSRWTLNAYGAVEYFYLSGKSINGNQATDLWGVPINIGLKPVYEVNANTQYYFAIGPRYAYIRQHNHSSYVFKNKSRNNFGFFINTGFSYDLCNHFVIDIFGEYSYSKMHFHEGSPNIYTRNVQMGAFTFGVGIGYEF